MTQQHSLSTPAIIHAQPLILQRQRFGGPSFCCRCTNHAAATSTAVSPSACLAAGCVTVSDTLGPLCTTWHHQQLQHHQQLSPAAPLAPACPPAYDGSAQEHDRTTAAAFAAAAAPPPAAAGDLQPSAHCNHRRQRWHHSQGPGPGRHQRRFWDRPGVMAQVPGVTLCFRRHCRDGP